MIALVENALLLRQVPLVTIRRGMTAFGSSVQAMFLVLFGLARAPAAATAAYAGITAGHCFRGSGASANYYEVGGQDTAMINAVRGPSCTMAAVVVTFCSRD